MTETIYPLRPMPVTILIPAAAYSCMSRPKMQYTGPCSELISYKVDKSRYKHKSLSYPEAKCIQKINMVSIVDKMTILGTIVDSKLSWDENCSLIIKKVNAIMQLLRSLQSFGAKLYG